MDPSPNSPAGSDRIPGPGTPDPVPAPASSSPGGAPGGAAPTPVPHARRPLSRPAIIGLALAALVILIAGLAWAGTGYRYDAYVEMPAALTGKLPPAEKDQKALVTKLERRSKELTAKLRSTAPRGVYIVIDQTQNRLYLKKDEETLLDARCSAGSGMVLKETSGKKRQWVFDTPRGRFEVLTLLRNPVWAKPDWAFVEEGQPIPRNPEDRLESGTLGEYALYFGDGFMIHGTLYERLLGRAVSHGCIRVGRDDLRKVWANARIGMPIYIY